MRLVAGDELYPYLPPIADLIREHLPGFTGVENHQAIAVVEDEAPLAVILYGNYTLTDLHMHIASNNRAWCKRGMLRGLFEYPFEQVGVSRVTAMVAKRNKHARQFVERLGFRHEGTHPKGFPDGGTACSYGLLKENCKWL